MTKKEISRLVYNNTQLSLVDSQEAVQATFDAIAKILLRYGRVELRGFGVFSVQKRAARMAHKAKNAPEPVKTKKAPEPVKTKKAPAPAKKTNEKPVAKAPAKKTTKKSAK